MSIIVENLPDTIKPLSLLDVNGVELKTGQTVHISRTWFKQDSGYYLIVYSPEDPGCGHDHIGLLPLTEAGKLKKIKTTMQQWPLYTQPGLPNVDLINRWNSWVAAIEVVEPINRKFNKQFFGDILQALQNSLPTESEQTKLDPLFMQLYLKQIDFYSVIVNSI